MPSIAPSIDVVTHTLRARRDAVREVLKAMPDKFPVQTFLVDVLGHYDAAVEELEAGADPHAMLHAAVASYVQSMVQGRYCCGTAFADIAQALGAEITYA